MKQAVPVDVDRMRVSAGTKESDDGFADRHRLAT